MITTHLIALWLLIFTSDPAKAADSSISHIKSVIQQQLKAFNEDDYDAAYQYASRHIQSVFSRTEFETMVRTGYPQIAKSRKKSFGEITLSDKSTRAIAIVRVTGVDRITVIAQYKTVLEEGTWKINGVMILEQITPRETVDNAMAKNL